MSAPHRQNNQSPPPADASRFTGGGPACGGEGFSSISHDEVARRMARMAAGKQEPLGTRLDQDAQQATGVQILNAATWLRQLMPEIRQLLPGLLDAGAKMLLNGSSKARKTFLVVQLALCAAAGRRFLRWTPPGPCRVLLLQGEVTAAHFHARLVRALASLGMTISDLGDRLQIVNSRGHVFTLDTPPNWLKRAAADVDLVVVDPVYKFFHGEENSGTDAAAFLRGLDLLTEQSGAALVYVHHTAKGTAGDRQTIDRGSGSGVFARDFDASLYLGQHREVDGVLVVEPIVRAYPPVDAFTIEFQDGVFVESDHAPVVLRSSDRRGDRTPPPALLPAIRSLLDSHVMQKTDLIERLRVQSGASRAAARAAVDQAISGGEIELVPGVGWPRRILLRLNADFQQSADTANRDLGNA